MQSKLLIPSRRGLVAASVALALTLSAGLSQAVTVSATDFRGGNVMQMGDATFRAHGGNFFTTGGTVGVSSGFQDDELDITNESISVEFANGGAVIDQIVLGRLYGAGGRGDAVDEAGQFLVTPAAGPMLCEVCNFDASGNFDGPGGMAQSSAPGTWTFENPFGDQPISELALRAFSMGVGGSRDSDFAIVSISYSMGLANVPEPGTALMMGIGLVSLARAGRPRH